MRACCHNCAGARDIGGVDIVFAQPHIGAILAIENQGKAFLITDPQQHQCGQAIGIDFDALDIDPFAGQFFANKAPHMLVTHTRDKARFQPQTRCACGHIGG